MTCNEAETRYYLIDPILRGKGYDDHQRLKLEPPESVEPTGAKGRRCRGGGLQQLFLSQEDLARELGVSDATDNRWENSQAKPSKLARV